MKRLLKPQEFYYLSRPMRSDPAHLIKYTLLGLFVEGHVDAYYKSVYISKNARDKRPRIFIKKGANYKADSNYTKAEVFVLALLDPSEIRLYEFRNLVLDKLDGDIGTFKYDFVYKDVFELGLCHSTWLLNGSGRKARQECEGLMDELDENISTLLVDKVRVKKLLDALGTNIVFLEENTLSKLKLKIINLDELYDQFNPQPGRGSGGSGSSISFGSYSSGGSGGGGWGGYGGGGFGGGGSGGSW